MYCTPSLTCWDMQCHLLKGNTLQGGTGVRVKSSDLAKFEMLVRQPRGVVKEKLAPGLKFRG